MQSNDVFKTMDKDGYETLLVASNSLHPEFNDKSIVRSLYDLLDENSRLLLFDEGLNVDTLKEQFTELGTIQVEHGMIILITFPERNEYCFTWDGSRLRYHSKIDREEDSQ